MFKAWAAGPVLFTIVIFGWLLYTGGPDAVDRAAPEANLFGGTRPSSVPQPLGIAPPAADMAWDRGSSSVLSELADCIRRAGEGPGGSSILPPRAGSDPQDPASLSSPAGYFRDVCASRFTGPAWREFGTSYGRRPVTWVARLLTVADAEAERLSLQPGADPGEAWTTAYAGVPERLEELRRRLLDVYAIDGLAGESAVADGGER